MTRALRRLAVFLSICTLCLCTSGCKSMSDMSSTFALAYAQSVSPAVYEENMKAITQYFTPEMQAALKNYPAYLEPNKRASAEIVTSINTDVGAIVYADVVVDEDTKYTIRFEMVCTKDKRQIQSCTYQVMYKFDPVMIN